jgi:hypothetical protein
MINKQQAVDAKHGDIFYHRSQRNADGTPLRARVSGVCKTWVKQPEKFKLPMKHGLRACFYITEDDTLDWCTTETAALVERP